MADITDANAVKFCNEHIRVGANLIAQSYYLCDAVQERFAALGSNQAALDIVASDVVNAAGRVQQAFLVSFESYRFWFASGIDSIITNTDVDQIIDGSPEDGRPQLDGDDVHNVVTQFGEYQGWMSTGTFIFNIAGSWAWYDAVLQMQKSTLVLADVTNFMTRCTELRTQMEATSNLKLNQLLEVAVNPSRE